MEGINLNQIGVSFKGSGSYVPNQILTNQEISKKVETSDEWIKSRTGISQRRISGLLEKYEVELSKIIRKNISLEGKNRNLAGKTASPSGLYFVGPSYKKKFMIPDISNTLT